jgi:hypothetical protein
MDDLFKGLQLEFSLDNTFSSTIERACMENEKLLLYAAGVLDVKPPPFVGKLTFNCGRSFFARMGINVSGLRTENGKTVIICDIPILDYDQYLRSYARVNANIATELTLLKSDADNDLNPISRPVHGILKNFSPAGARIGITKNDVSMDTIAKNLPVFTRLHFTLPHHPKELQIVGKLVKVENAFRTVYLGIQFILKTFGDFRLIEDYYHKLMKPGPADKKAKEALEKDVKQLK